MSLSELEAEIGSLSDRFASLRRERGYGGALRELRSSNREAATRDELAVLSTIASRKLRLWREQGRNQRPHRVCSYTQADFDEAHAVQEGLLIELSLIRLQMSADIVDLASHILTLKRQLKDWAPMNYRGVWQPGQYERGAVVTHAGSMFHCNNETDDKPGESSAWVLCCKKGRDGKDARP